MSDNRYNPAADADGLDPRAWVPNLASAPFDDDDDDLYGSGAGTVEFEDSPRYEYADA